MLQIMDPGIARPFWWIGVVLATVTACGEPLESPAARGTSTITISADVSPVVVGLSVEVTAPDITTPLVQNIPVVAGVATGTVTIPAGSRRLLTVRAFDQNAIETHRGTAAVDVESGTNAEVTIILDPLTGGQPIVVNAATYTIVLTPTDVAVDILETVPFSATVTDANGPVRNPSLVWGALNPVVASVDQTGLATPGTGGTTSIVVNYRGIAVATRLTVLDVPTERIVFTARRAGTTSVYSVTPFGTGLRRLTMPSPNETDTEPRWSPDGARIAFVRWYVTPAGVSDVIVMHADGTDVVRLTAGAGRNYNHAWSPDGRQLAFVSDRDGNAEIYVVNADGTGLANLTNDGAADTYPAWSPDGRLIAFNSNRNGTDDIWVMNADGSAASALTNDPAVSDRQPIWSPRGDAVLVRAYSAGGPFGNVHIVNLDGTGRVSVTNRANFSPFSATWSPDGSRIAVNGEESTRTTSFIIGSDGSGTVVLTDNDFSTGLAPQWSPDGRRVVFLRDPDGNTDLYVSDADGSGRTRLTTDPDLDYWPAWSPVALPAAVAGR